VEKFDTTYNIPPFPWQNIHIEWVINSGQYSPRPEKKVPSRPQVGLVNGLAVYGPNMGMVLEVECNVIPALRGQGKLTVTGMVEEEEIGGSGRTVRRKSMARSSVENVLTVLRRTMEVDLRDYDIHVNFPGGAPTDGPSAGVTVATAVYSAIMGLPVDNRVAMTGEVSIRGLIKPVGGIVAKVEAARQAGFTTTGPLQEPDWRQYYNFSRQVLTNETQQ
jgi:Lon-like ATP-dependent protease